MEKHKNFIEAKINLQQSAFICAQYAEIDIEDLPEFIREVARDIEEEIKKQADE